MEDFEKVSIINQTVRVINAEEGIDNTGIISFMYPSYIIKDDIFFDYGNDVIYNGKYKFGIKDELAHGTKSFIALTNNSNSDVDFTNRDVIIKVLYSKWNKKPSEATLSAIEGMSEEEFWDFFKKFWVLGRNKIDDKGVSIYNLYKVLGKQRHEILKVYFELREVYSDSTIFSSVLGFIEKALNPDQVSSQNGRYIKMLEDFQKSFGSSIIPIIQKCYVMKGTSDSDKEYRTLWLLMQLGKGNII